MTASAEATNRFFGITEKSVVALPLSVDYIAGKMMVVRALTASCRLLELPVSNTVEINEKVNLLSVVPSQLPSLLSNQNSLNNIDNLLIGGAPLSISQEEKLVEKGVKAWLSYGMTETCSHVAIRRVGEDDVFKAMPGISFAVDMRGCLVILSENFSWKQIVTNDMVELVDSQSFRWLGRIDNVVNSGGLKLHPEQIERLIRKSIPDIVPFYLTSEVDEILGQRLVMVAEGAPDGLIDLLREKINNHRILPKRIVSAESLPLTSNGKVKRLKPLEIHTGNLPGAEIM